MKKMICVVLSLILLLSLAACQPADNQPTNAPTNAPTDAPAEPLPTKPNPTLPNATEPAPTDPPAPAEMPVNGVCAVGIVDAEAGTAKVLADNGYIGQISYTCDSDLIPGNLYYFAKNGDVYTLTAVTYHYGDYVVNPRTFDNAAAGYADQLYTHDGTNGYLFDLTEDCVVFVRFSETEYRLFTGSDAIKASDWPIWMYFAVTPHAEITTRDDGTIMYGTTNIMLVVGDPNQGKMHANEATSYFFDQEGFGWDYGDLIIE